MNINAKLSIIRTQSSKGDSHVSIEITDDSSGSRIIELAVDMATFAEAITGIGHVPCTAVFYENAPVGKRREVKEEEVSFDPFTQNQNAVLVRYEVDGWKAERRDLGNPHKRVPRRIDNQNISCYRVSFVRFVDSA